MATKLKLTNLSGGTPGSWADKGGRYDCTLYIGQLHTEECAWPMYSYDRPSSILWNGIAEALYKRGWSDKQIRHWLQSKEPRWALDGSLGEAIEKLASDFAANNIVDPA